MLRSSPPDAKLEWVDKGRGRQEAWHRSMVCFVLTEQTGGLCHIEARVWNAGVWSAVFKNKEQAERAGLVIADAVYEKFG